MRVLILLVLVLTWAPALSAQAPATAQTVDKPKKTYFWLRMWPDFLVKYDVAADRVVGKVKNKNGVAHGSQLSFDRKKLLTITGQKTTIEVTDLASLEVEDEHSFKREGYIIRIDSAKECPGGTHWYVKIQKIKNNLNHYEIEKPEWLYYNVEEEKIEKKMKELPKAIRSGARISPCGTKWHVFGKDITIVDPKTLKEEGKIELSKPQYTGMGALRVRGADFFDGKNVDGYRMFYTMSDPVKTSRSLLGIVDIDIKNKKVTKIRELGWNPRIGRFHLTKDRKMAVAQIWGGGRGRSGGDPEITLFNYDVENGRKLRETRVKIRNGLSLAAVSPDGKKLYLTGRGHELVIYDDHHKYLKTVEMGGEIDGRILVVEE